jgi:hypothetical protein
MVSVGQPDLRAAAELEKRRLDELGQLTDRKDGEPIVPTNVAEIFVLHKSQGYLKKMRARGKAPRHVINGVGDEQTARKWYRIIELLPLKRDEAA